MAIKVIVFDFDGTLVDSNQIKYEAYFELFPQNEEYRTFIHAVLDTNFEESRFVILEKILKSTRHLHSGANVLSITEMAHKYNSIVMDAVKKCPEMPGAEDIVRKLSKHMPVYLSSTTPEMALREIVIHRGWGTYFKAIYGYPNKKNDTLKKIIIDENVIPGEVMVVGDGESDKTSACEGGCQFVLVDQQFKLYSLSGILERL